MSRKVNFGHKGLREFTGDEIGNLTLGQAGFKILTNDEYECGVASYSSVIGFPDIAFFVALKAVDADAEVEARVVPGLTDSDDLTLASDGDYETGSNPVTIENGDIVYGPFDKVEVASGDYVIAYIGKTYQKKRRIIMATSSSKIIGLDGLVKATGEREGKGGGKGGRGYGAGAGAGSGKKTGEGKKGGRSGKGSSLRAKSGAVYGAAKAGGGAAKAGAKYKPVAKKKPSRPGRRP